MNDLRKISGTLCFWRVRGLRRRTREGFTLIELLVTIAIIAVLAALLLSVLSSARLKAQQVHCLSNVKQLGIVGFLYLNDNNKHPSHDDPEFPGGGAWMGTLNVTAREKGIGTCPAAPLREPVPDAGNGQGTADKAWVRWTSNERMRLFGSYGFNSWLYSQPANRRPGTWPHSFNGNIPNPANTPVFADENWVDAPPWEKDLPFHDLYTGSPLNMRGDNIGRFTISRHGGSGPARAPRHLSNGAKLPGSINVSFADGHSKLVPLEQLWSLEWHLDWETPSTRPQNPR
jgi:prepilin-type N-terminal cleavage/methylation domain-containing protein/prepilin-type processing-associated H-X9-DG protein